MSEVPADLIVEVLLSLSVDTVLRFRCVSKSLCDIIDDSKFIKSHLPGTRTDRKIVIRHRRRHHISPAPIHVFDMEDPFPRDLSENSRISDSSIYQSYCYFAHCDGLIVLEEGCGLVSLVVWNPSIRKCRKLPVIPDKEERKQLWIIGMCFGYDSSIDDYKVMVMKERKHNDFTENYKPKYRIWVLGLRSGYWRRIELPRDFRNRYLGSGNCFVDGGFYFNCSGTILLAFDLAKETFSQVPVPDFIKTQLHQASLVVVEGCLCLKIFPLVLFSRKKNDEGEFSWIKLFDITSNAHFRTLVWGKILGFSKDKDKIYFLRDQIHVYSYDVKEKNMRRTLAGDGRNHKMFSCIASLVWIDEEESERKRKGNSATSLSIN